MKKNINPIFLRVVVLGGGGWGVVGGIKRFENNNNTIK